MNQSFVIGYFGGSITEGAGASDPEKTSWRALTTAWLAQRFPEFTVTGVNAAIGGTGSDLGAFRCSHDLLVHRPDLVFVEFAVNDKDGAREWILRSLEGVVRQIRIVLPRSEIVLVYTTTKDKPSREAQIHQEVADYYCLPVIDVGKALWQAIGSGVLTVEQALPDGVHPSDAGYAVYAQQVRRFLQTRSAPFVAPSAVMPSKPLVANPLVEAGLIDAWEWAGEGWTKDPADLAGRYPHRLCADGPGFELIVVFQGRVIGLYWLVAPDSGDIEWSLDAGLPQTLSSFDQYALHFTRAHCRILASDLPDGPHTLHLKVLATRQHDSTGHALRLGAFLVSR